MPTQYGEDRHILEYFAGRVGRFLDVGAGDGLTWSNTKPLLDLGWSGVMVEPALSQIRWLLENHLDNPKVDIVCAGIGGRTRSSLALFFDARDFSTFSDKYHDKITAHSEGSVLYRLRFAPMITWRQLLDACPGPYDFVNIDVEGMNLELVQSAPWDRIRPQMVCVEVDPQEALAKMMCIFAEYGLEHSELIGGNLLVSMA